MEPMTLGSPTHSPSGSPITNILPPFMVGEYNQPTPRTNSLSPTKGRNATFGTSPPSKPIQPQYSTPVRSKPLQNTSFSNKINGPPTQGLFDTLHKSDWNANQSIQSPSMGITSPYASNFNVSHQEDVYNQLDNSYMAGNLSFMQNQSAQYNKSFGVSQYSTNVNTSTAPDFYNTSVMSDTANEVRHGEDDTDCWITVFGFPASASNMVVTQFSNCGNILEKKFPPQGNWVWLRFMSRAEAMRALALNGRVLTGNLMIGVAACPNPPPSNRNAPRHLTAGPTRLNSSLLASPNTSGSQVGAQRSTGPLSKALEYVFGW